MSDTRLSRASMEDAHLPRFALLASALPAEVHGHEVIAMILESQQAYTRESLAHAIVDRFGAQTRFFTCSAAGMTAPELVEFLESRGKFMPIADGFTIDPGRVCQH